MVPIGCNRRYSAYTWSLHVNGGLSSSSTSRCFICAATRSTDMANSRTARAASLCGPLTILRDDISWCAALALEGSCVRMHHRTPPCACVSRGASRARQARDAQCGFRDLRRRASWNPGSSSAPISTPVLTWPRKPWFLPANPRLQGQIYYQPSRNKGQFEIVFWMQ